MGASRCFLDRSTHAMMGGETRKNARPFLGEGEEEDEDIVAGSGGDDDRASGTAASFAVSGDSLFSSRSSLTDEEEEEGDDVTSPPEGGRKSRSSSSDSMQLDGEDGGPLYELSPLLADLPVRTGLSKFYQGRSQSFTSLSDAKCVEDLAKKTIPYSSRMKASRGYTAATQGSNRPSNFRHGPGPCRKAITKKTPRGSSDGLLSRARSKPPGYQSKNDVYRF